MINISRTDKLSRGEIMKPDQLMIDSYFSNNIGRVVVVIVNYFKKTSKIMPHILMQVDQSHNIRAGKWKAHFEILQPRGVDDIKIGVIEIDQTCWNGRTISHVTAISTDIAHDFFFTNLSNVLNKRLARLDGIQDSIFTACNTIPDHGYQRKLLEFWLKGMTAAEIGEVLDIQPRTVYNVLSTLRKKYGKEIVPLRKNR